MYSSIFFILSVTYCAFIVVFIVCVLYIIGMEMDRGLTGY